MDYNRDQFIQAWKERLNQVRLIPPKIVERGPLLENVFEGKDIDLLSLPAPHWHERDGGRYLGTCDLVIARDPDEGWVNLGCYRVMVHDRDACRPYEWMKDFPPVSGASAELKARVLEKFGKQLAHAKS